MTTLNRLTKLDAQAVSVLMRSLPEWQLSLDGIELSRRFDFGNFDTTVNFVNRLAALAKSLNHHPELHVGHSYCVVRLTTHDAGGLTILDANSARAVQDIVDEITASTALSR